LWKKKECRKVVFESIGIMIKKHPEKVDYIQQQFNDMCKESGIDFYAEFRISGKDIEECLDKLKQ
jgi:hypothetical protein